MPNINHRDYHRDFLFNCMKIFEARCIGENIWVSFYGYKVINHVLTGFELAIRNMQFAKHFCRLRICFCIFSKNCESLKSNTS